ncbi:MAG: hypothetical protein PHV93_04730 [Candidatus Pacebacteria bacterium]|nr:hypothetical protein [Candidatus Paceibacterota bacterium]
MVDTTGEQDLRAENFEKIVKGFALQEFKMKQLVMESSSNAWIETYYRETATELTGGLGSAVKGIPRLANFPYGEPSWTKVQSYIEKYGMEGVVSWEDAMTDNVDVIARTLLRISRAVAYAVDSQIYTALLGAAGNTVAVVAGFEWNSAVIANRDPIQNILDAKKELYVDNFNPDQNGFLVVNPAEYAYLLGNAKITNSPTFKSADVITNGVVGQICGLKIIVSNVVTTDTGTLVVIAKECGTWKAAAPLSVHTIPDDGVKYTIRAFEMGVCQVQTPNAICSITNTAS